MNKLKKIVLWAIGIIVGLLLLAAIASFAFVKLGPRYDISPAAYHWEKEITKEEVAEISEDLLSQMTLEEKMEQMAGESINLPRVFMHVYWEKRLGIGYAGRNTRLDIPPLAFTDGPRGVNTARGTCFPIAMARGASWDRGLEKRVGDAIGKEARAVKANYFAGLCINLLRHPAWGRSQETYGEDPWLLGEMGVALQTGVQAHNVMACAKHFACNSIENSRFYVDVKIDERALREVYLPHFKKCVDNGVASIMSSYNKVNGEHAGHSHHLLTEILRDDWGFEGFITSDWMNGIRNGEKAALAGMDVEMPRPRDYGDNLVRLIEEGKVPMEQIDKMVLRILKTKIWYVTRKDSMVYTDELFAAPDHITLAREAAEKGMVLLKNEQNVLPFDKNKVKTIALIGKLVDVENNGDHASSIVQSINNVTPLEGIKEYLGNSVTVLHSNGDDLEEAKAMAEKADAVLLVLGLEHDDEGEYINMGEKGPRTLEEEMEARNNKPWWYYLVGGDRLDLNLDERDQKVINAVAGINENTALAMIGGGAILMDEWKDKIPAILMAWYPGMEGGNAIANVVFGEVNPSGKLPLTIPKNVEQLPHFDAFTEHIDYGYYHGYTLFDKKKMEASYPFGYGLSYTTFKYDSLKVLTPEISKDGTLRVSVQVSNTGNRVGEEVVQLYIGFDNATIDRPVKLLRDFKKISLVAGETKVVDLEVPGSELAYFNTTADAWEIEEVVHSVLVGGTSDNNSLLRGEFLVSENGNNL